MAIRYFNADIELDPKSIQGMKNFEFREKFGKAIAFRLDYYHIFVGKPLDKRHNEYLPVERKIDYKSNPSKHVCSVKCRNGKRNGTCECQCNGKNHGLNFFTDLVKTAATQ